LAVHAILEKARANLPAKPGPSSGAKVVKPAASTSSVQLKKERSFTKSGDSMPAQRDSLESAGGSRKIPSRNGAPKVI